MQVSVIEASKSVLASTAAEAGVTWTADAGEAIAISIMAITPIRTIIVLPQCSFWFGILTISSRSTSGTFDGFVPESQRFRIGSFKESGELKSGTTCLPRCFLSSVINEICWPSNRGRHSMWVTSFALMVGLSAGNATEAQKAVPKWQVAVAPALCTVTGAITDPVVTGVSLWTIPGSDIYGFGLVGSEIHRRPLSSREQGRIEFGENVKPFPVSAMFLKKNDVRAIRADGLGGDFAEAFASAPTVLIQYGREKVGPVTIPPSAGAMRAFKSCIADQLVEWGADPAQFLPGGVTAKAKPDRERWLSVEQMAELPHKGDQVDVILSMSVMPDGSVGTCQQVGGITNKPAADSICDILKAEPRFTPALDKEGRPVRGAASYRLGLLRRVEFTTTRLGRGE